MSLIKIEAERAEERVRIRHFDLRPPFRSLLHLSHFVGPSHHLCPSRPTLPPVLALRLLQCPPSSDSSSFPPELNDHTRASNTGDDEAYADSTSVPNEGQG
ncbi:hypothetical protein QN277_025284 [Acacia crassicarpa]|uniref:Uncharacterized protein n=1 Tax=Acacia crassicarpa TaxID=499986 RepID=A0AAE1JIJ3_9FABA|nr:hypothetical protein QN277_025284 [Acacia crassicarpa]